MKLRNRIVSAVMALVASMTFVGVTAFAADAAVSLKASATEVKAGDTFTIEIDTTGNPGVCYLSYTITATNSNWTLTSFADAKLFSGYVKNTKYDKETYKMDWWIDDMGEEFATDTGVTGTLTYTVNADATPGDYVINVTSQAIVDDTLMPVDFASDSITIKVVDPAPTYTKYEVSESSDNNKGKEGSTDKYYSYGIKTTITPNSWTLNALDYKFTKDGGATYVSSKDNDALIGWSTPFAGESVLTFAVNVVNIPNDVVVAGSFEYDWTDPAAE